MSDLPKFDRTDFDKKGYTSLAAYAKEVLKTDYNNVDYRNADLSRLHLADCKFTANFDGADFTETILDNVTFEGGFISLTMCEVKFNRAMLINCTFKKVYLDAAQFYQAYIRSGDFTKCDICSANFLQSGIADTKFSKCNLYCSNFSHSSWSAISFSDSSLRYASTTDIHFSGNLTLVNTKIYGTSLIMACPIEGAFIGWKKIVTDDDEYLVKILVPEDAKRSSATTDKCRCSKAKVLDIVNISTDEHIKSITNKTYRYTEYIVGEIVKPDFFDENRWEECSHGIHFFVDKESALEYDE